VEVFREPSPGGYAREQRATRGGAIALTAFPDVVVAVDEFLPPS